MIIGLRRLLFLSLFSLSLSLSFFDEYFFSFNDNKYKEI